MFRYWWPMSGDGLVPTFYLYGEPTRAVDADFLHVERLADRSRPSEWTIRPHAHVDLDQIFLIEVGGGGMVADERRIAFSAPAMLVVPAGVVHGFDWHSDSSGWVLTASRAHVEALGRRHGEVAGVLHRASALELDGPSLRAAAAAMEALSRELGWAAPGRWPAIEGLVLGLLVSVLRLSPVPAVPGGARSAAALVARFRGRLEDRFRLREPVATFAKALGVSETRLRTACVRVAGRPPAAMLDERSLLEARRALSYSHLSVAEIGYALGFADPAYFSRFFSRHAGMSPSAYRSGAGG